MSLNHTAPAGIPYFLVFPARLMCRIIEAYDIRRTLMNGKRDLTAILRNDRITRLIFGGMVMDGLLLISLLAMAVSIVR
jgi:hypothetical protein